MKFIHRCLHALLVAALFSAPLAVSGCGKTKTDDKPTTKSPPNESSSGLAGGGKTLPKTKTSDVN